MPLIMYRITFDIVRKLSTVIVLHIGLYSTCTLLLLNNNDK